VEVLAKLVEVLAKIMEVLAKLDRSTCQES
jgi:hypothetical protein